jgi:membrane protein
MRGTVNYSRQIRKLKIVANRLVIPGFEKIPFLTVMRFFIESLIKGILFQRAAAMAYRIFIALIPMMMSLFAAISFLDESIRIQLMEFIETLVPDYTWPAVSNVISGVLLKQNGMLFYTSFGIGLYLSILMMNAIITSLNITYFKIKTRILPKQLMVSAIMVIVFFIAVIVAVAIFVGASYALRRIELDLVGSSVLFKYSIAVFKWIFLFITAYLCLSALFYFAPVNKKYFRFFSAGSMFTTISLIVLFYALNFYFYHFPTYNLIYGSLGALFAIIITIYWSCLVVLIGFDLNISIFIAKQKASETGFISLKSTAEEE